jgi:cytochrome c-type biogenesis protein CcmE
LIFRIFLWSSLIREMNNLTISTRAKLIVALIIVVSIIGVLIETAITKASTYYITVHELYSEGAAGMHHDTAVSGDIVGASVRWDPKTRLLSFSIKDDTSSQTLLVRFRGDKPDSLTNNWPVIAFGQLNSGGQFEATKLLVKCPSKYSAKDEQRTYTAK